MTVNKMNGDEYEKLIGAALLKLKVAERLLLAAYEPLSLPQAIKESTRFQAGFDLTSAGMECAAARDFAAKALRMLVPKSTEEKTE